VLSEITAAIPGALPPQSDDSCDGRALVVSLSSGRSLDYGPCSQPPAIRTIRAAIDRASR